jgi:hypothetical protein
MATTPQDIIVAALARSTKNKPGTIATASTELFHVVVRLLRGLYSYAATVNYTVFAGLLDVTATTKAGGPVGVTKGWQRPGDAELVFRIERTATTTGGVGTTGDPVIVVPYDDRQAETGLPAVFRMGQTYFPAGNAIDPTGGDLRFFFSRVPDDPKSFIDPLDAQWIEQYNDLLIIPCAIYLAKKDGRADEVPGLESEQQAWMALFTEFLKHPELERRRIGLVRRIPGTPVSPATAG